MYRLTNAHVHFGLFGPWLADLFQSRANVAVGVQPRRLINKQV